MSNKRHFVYQDEKSNKFWDVSFKLKGFTVTYGRIGTSGVSIQKSFETAFAAENAYEKVVESKLKKGYREV